MEQSNGHRRNAGAGSRLDPRHSQKTTALVDSTGRTIVQDNEQSANFQAWFGSSKVSDDFGRPLVVYHGTNHDIEEFQVSPQGIIGAGIYLTSDPVDAEEYAGYDTDGANVLPVYISLLNPIIVNADTAWSEITEIATGKRAGVDTEPDEEECAEVLASLLDLGHDGIISTTLGGPTHYVVFTPGQVKSAIGNSGIFDPDSPSLVDTNQSSRQMAIAASLALVAVEPDHLKTMISIAT